MNEVVVCGECSSCGLYSPPGFVPHPITFCTLSSLEVDAKNDGCTLGTKGAPTYQNLQQDIVTIDDPTVWGCHYYD